MTDKTSLWKNPSGVNCTFSRDYLGAEKPEFKNTFIYRCKTYDEVQDEGGCRRRRRSAENTDSLFDSDYQYDTGYYFDENLQAGSDGNVEITGTCDCLYESERCSGKCTPQNCSQHFWTKESVGAYFTLEAYDVKPEKLQQMHRF